MGVMMLDGNLDTTFVLQIYNGNQEYSAGFFFNTLPEYQLTTDGTVTDMFFKNRNLYIQDASTLKTVTPIRSFYTSASLYNSVVLVFTQDYQTLTF